MSSQFTSFYYLPNTINETLGLNKILGKSRIYIFSNYESVIKYYNNNGSTIGAGNNSMGYLEINGTTITVYDLNNNSQYSFPESSNITNNINITSVTTETIANTSVTSSYVNNIVQGIKIRVTLYPIYQNYSTTQVIGVVLASN